MARVRISVRVAIVALMMAAAACDERRQPDGTSANVRDAPGTSTSASIGPIAFTGVTVIDAAAATRRSGITVVIQGDRITAVGPDSGTTLEASTTRIDAGGRFLIPGLWDAHAHLSYPGACALPIMVANGVTSVRDLGGPPAEGVTWRREIAEGRRVGPRLFLAGLNIESAAWMDGVERMVREHDQRADERIRRLWTVSPRFQVRTRGDARSAVDTARRLGMDLVKFRNLADKSFRDVANAAREARLPLAGHAPDDISLADAADAGLRSLEHSGNLSALAELPVGERQAQYARIVRRGMFVTPTLVSDGMWAPDSMVLAALSDTAGRYDPRRRTLSPGQATMWRDMLNDRRMWSTPASRATHDSGVAVLHARVREAHRAGVPLLAGTDLGVLLTYPGSSLHEELAIFVEHVGLSTAEALRTATINPARFFGIEDEIGTIAPGKRADLVLLRDDPLLNIRNLRNVEGVVAAGRYFGPDALAAMMACRAP